MAETIFPPQIIGQPQSRAVATNESVAFTVVVADPRSLSYQWRFNGNNLSGETGASLLLSNVTTNNEGEYSVVLTNPSGSVTSAPAMLWIDNDHDLMGDSWELAHFGNLNQNATSDFDHDGISNLREFQDGTDPTDPNSARYRLIVVREGGAVLKNPDQSLYDKGQTVRLTAITFSNELFHAWLGDVVSRDNPVTLVMTNDKTIYARFTPIAFTWINPTSGNWEDASNWNPQLVPGLNDSVLINTPVTVTLTTNANCVDFTLANNAATLTGSGTLRVQANLFWTDGTMGGTGRTIVESNAVLNLNNPAGTASLNTRTLENAGTILWSGGYFFVGGGGVITNRLGALFRFESATAAFMGGGIASGSIDNAGDFRKPAGSGPLTLNAGLSLNNFGTLEIETNTLTCNGSFLNNGTVTLSPFTTNRMTAGGGGSGTINNPANSLVEWTNGNFTFGAGAQLNGAGLYRINGSSTFVANGNTTVSNLDMTSGSSTLGGTGTLSIAGTMNWSGGTMNGAGATLIAPRATMNLGQVSLGRTLENGGTVLWTGSGLILSGAIITNRSGAIFDAQNDATPFFAGVACRFDNVGTFRKSAGAGATTLPSGVAFNNLGAVEIQTGRFVLAGGGSATGAFTVSAPSVIEWTAGGFALNPGVQLNGLGLYKVNGATVTGNASFTASNFDIAAGTLDGSAVATLAGTMNWSGGTMTGSGRTLIAPGATLNLSTSSGVSLGRSLENAGTVLWTGSGNLGMGVITNRAGALFDVRNSAGLNFFAANPRFDNAGTFRKSVSSGTTTVSPSFTNYGTVEVQSGTLLCNGSFGNSGTVNLSTGTTHRLPGGGFATGTFDAASSALVEWAGSTFTLIGGAQLNGSGLYRISGGTLVDNAALTAQNLDLSFGALDGSAVLTVGSLMNWTGGTMNGSGRTVIAPAATLNVGSSSVLGLDTRTLENAGTAIWTGSGGIQFASAAITNRSGALFHAQNAASFSFIGSGRFENAGTFRKSVSAGQVFAGMTFNNYGTVEVQTGTLSLGNNSTHSGSFTVLAGATLAFSGGVHSANAGSSITGAGQLTVSGGSATLPGLVNVAGNHTFSGGTANFTGTHFCTNNTVIISGGTANWSGSGLVSPAILNLSSGTLSGTSPVTVNSLMNWTGGEMNGSGRTIIAPGSTLNIVTPVNGVNLINRSLENAGTALWTGPGAIVYSQGVITNRAGALFNAQNSASFANLGAPNRFDNAGVFRKSVNTGTTAFNAGPFNNYGTVDIRSGVLAANGGYVSSPGALLNCAISGIAPGTGFGQLQAPGTVTLNGGLSVELSNGFVPATNDAFAVLTAGTRNGTFSGFSYPSNAVTMLLSNTPNSAIVRVTDVFSFPQPAPLPAGLISWWRAEGNGLDSAGTNHGTLTNGATFAAGKVGQTFALDGVDDYVQAPDSTSLRPASVSIEAWVKFFATNGIRIVLGKPLGSNTTFDSYGLALQDGAVLAAICDNTGFGPFLTGPANTVTGQWYHLAYTFDDSSKQQILYVNGSPVASGTANKTISYDSHPVLLGVDVENGVLNFFHNGLIDEASLYNRALTRDEVVTIFNAGPLGKRALTPYEQWKQIYLGDINASDTADPDGDGFNNLAEYIADTNPTNAFSNLRITGVAPIPTGVAIQWQGGTLATQFLQRSFSLSPAVWQDLLTNLPPTSSSFGFTNTVAPTNAQFYRIRVTR
jgi:hypothetical protein